MAKLIKGEKIKLNKFFQDLRFNVNVNIPIPENNEIDIACFGLDSQGHLSDDRYFVFFNQLISPEGAVEKSESENNFTINLDKLPSNIQKLVFTATIDGADFMSSISESSISITPSQNSELVIYEFNGSQFDKEKAIIIAEIYLSNNEWRFSIVSSGFNGGLEALLTFFGGEAEEDEPLEELENNTAKEASSQKSPPKPKKRRTSTKKMSKPPTDENSQTVYNGFNEQIISFVKRIRTLSSCISTEEATKTTIVMPFFQIMGFDVFNPYEFCPEYTADIGVKKGEKVDYAILINGEPVILIEVKPFNEALVKHTPQLFRYFVASKARFGILTNGIKYNFYTDLDKENVMDSDPFLEIDLFNLKEADFRELEKFRKTNLDIKEILDSASELKYLGLITHALKSDFLTPSDDYVRYILSKDVYSGIKTQNTIEKFRPLVKRAFSEYIHTLVNDKIQNALKNDMLNLDELDNADILLDDVPVTPDAPGIVTTQQEFEAYYIVKSLLSEAVKVSRITYKDTQTYFGINLDDKVTKWICRLVLREKKSYTVIPDEHQAPVKYPINTLDDLYHLKQVMLTRLEYLI